MQADSDSCVICSILIHKHSKKYVYKYLNVRIVVPFPTPFHTDIKTACRHLFGSHPPYQPTNLPFLIFSDCQNKLAIRCQNTLALHCQNTLALHCQNTLALHCQNTLALRTTLALHCQIRSIKFQFNLTNPHTNTQAIHSMRS